MAILRITSVPGFDGDYEFDFDGQQFNGRELHVIKTLAKLRPAEFEDAIRTGDYDFVIAVAVIVLIRAGKVDRARYQDAADLLLEAEAGKITVEDAVEADAGPPASPPASESESAGSSGNDEPTSGDGSNPTGGQQENTPSRTGTLGLVTGATSGPETLAS